MGKTKMRVLKASINGTKLKNFKKSKLEIFVSTEMKRIQKKLKAIKKGKKKSTKKKNLKRYLKNLKKLKSLIKKKRVLKYTKKSDKRNKKLLKITKMFMAAILRLKKEQTKFKDGMGSMSVNQV